MESPYSLTIMLTEQILHNVHGRTLKEVPPNSVIPSNLPSNAIFLPGNLYILHHLPIIGWTKINISINNSLHLPKGLNNPSHSTYTNAQSTTLSSFQSYPSEDLLSPPRPVPGFVGADGLQILPRAVNPIANQLWGHEDDCKVGFNLLTFYPNPLCLSE